MGLGRLTILMTSSRSNDSRNKINCSRSNDSRNTINCSRSSSWRYRCNKTQTGTGLIPGEVNFSLSHMLCVLPVVLVTTDTAVLGATVARQIQNLAVNIEKVHLSLSLSLEHLLYTHTNNIYIFREREYLCVFVVSNL